MREEVRAEQERRFWDRYIKALPKRGIKPPSGHWHVLRAEQFIKAFPARRLAEKHLRPAKLCHPQSV